MKNTVTMTAKQTKKSTLDTFQLFYEEIPLKADEAAKSAIRSRGERLIRRSRAK